MKTIGHLLIASLLVMLEAKHIHPGRHHEYKRSLSSLPASMSVHLFSQNATVMACPQAMMMPSLRMVHLDDSQMRTMFEGKGGNYMEDYMAATQEEAIQNFPNMIMLSMTDPADHNDTTLTITDNSVSKQVIMDDLHKLMTYLSHTYNISRKSSSSTPTSVTAPTFTPSTKSTKDTIPEVSKPTPPSNKQTLYPTPPMHTPALIPNADLNTLDNLSSPKTRTTLNALIPSLINTQSRFRLNNTTVKPRAKTTNTAIPMTSSLIANSFSPNVNLETSTISSTKDVTKSKQSNVMTSVSDHTSTTIGVTGPTVPSSVTTEDPDVQNSLNNFEHYLNGDLLGLDENNNTEMDKLWKDANTTIHPTSLLGLMSGRKRLKRNIEGSFTEENYCKPKGSPTEDGKFVHMCSMCAATTRLPDDYFPRYINEVVCKTDDSDCLIVNGLAHGECKQRTISLPLMKRQPEVCLVALHNGQTLVLEDWQIDSRRIRVSCECTINKLSLFKQYVAPPIG